MRARRRCADLAEEVEQLLCRRRHLHTLSKRSVVYGTLSRVQNRGAASYAVPGGPSGLAGGGNSTGVEFGLRHNF